jgi:hypothetical protein
MFQIIYSVQHKDCGELTRLSDYRIMSREDLKLHPDIKPLKMECRQCILEIDATYFEVWESEGLGMKKIVEVTPIDQLYDVCKKLTNS